MRALVASIALTCVACSSKPAPPVYIVHRTDGDLDAKVYVSSVRGTTRAGKAWIATDSLAMEVFRGKEWLNGPSLGCAVADQKTFDLRLDAKRAVLAYRCKPADAWSILHVAETAMHLDCDVDGGTGPEPDLAAAKTFLARADALARCAIDEKLARMSRDSAISTLAVDVHRASKSETRTAAWELVLLDELLAKGDTSWPRIVWNTEVLQGVNGDRAALPPPVYLELQRQASARLDKAKSVNEIFALVAVADGRDPSFAKAAPTALKVLASGARTGLSDAATSLVLGSLIATSDPRAPALGCEALGAGMTNGVAGLAASRGAKECPAAKTALHADPDHSKAWLETKCGAFDRAGLADATKPALDDKWKRKTLTDAAFNANPHELLVDWETGLLAATCPRR